MANMAATNVTHYVKVFESIKMNFCCYKFTLSITKPFNLPIKVPAIFYITNNFVCRLF